MELDPPRLRLLELIADRETDLKTVSESIGRNHAYLQQYIKRGSPRNLPEDVREELGRHFGVPPDEFKAAPKKMDQSPVAKAPEGRIVTVAGEEYALLPVYDLRLSAGPGAWTEGDGTPLYFEPARFQWLRSITNADLGHLMLAQVDGDSMEPTLRSGDQVLIHLLSKQPQRDGIYGIRRGDEMQVKRIAISPRDNTLTIISDNPAYPTWEGIDPDTVDVIGRVLWLGRRV